MLYQTCLCWDRCRASWTGFGYCLSCCMESNTVWSRWTGVALSWNMQFVLLVCQMLKYERKSRGQNLGKKVSFREKFDVAVARAVAEMRILAGCCLYLVRDGGLFIAAKGYNPQVWIFFRFQASTHWGSKKCREVTPIDGRISIATALRYYCCIINSGHSIFIQWFN